MKKKKKKVLKFDYCECGCHGSYSTHAGYWIYDDLRGNFHLHAGHGWTSPKVDTYKSYGRAADAATKRFVAHLKMLQKKAFE